MPLDQATDRVAGGVPSGMIGFPASASLGRSRGSEGPRPAPEFSRTGRWLPPRLPIFGEREADLRVSVVVRVQNRAGDGHGGQCVVCSFPRPRPDLSVPKPPPQSASSSDRDLGRNEAGRHRSVDDHA